MNRFSWDHRIKPTHGDVDEIFVCIGRGMKASHYRMDIPATLRVSKSIADNIEKELNLLDRVGLE